MENLIDVCREYLYLRTNTVGAERSQLHDQVMDGLSDIGIYYRDREHAAQIAKALVILDDASALEPLAQAFVESGGIAGLTGKEAGKAEAIPREHGWDVREVGISEFLGIKEQL